MLVVVLYELQRRDWLFATIHLCSVNKLCVSLWKLLTILTDLLSIHFTYEYNNLVLPRRQSNSSLFINLFSYKSDPNLRSLNMRTHPLGFIFYNPFLWVLGATSALNFTMDLSIEAFQKIFVNISRIRRIL